MNPDPIERLKTACWENNVFQQLESKLEIAHNLEKEFARDTESLIKSMMEERDIKRIPFSKLLDEETLADFIMEDVVNEKLEQNSVNAIFIDKDEIVLEVYNNYGEFVERLSNLTVDSIMIILRWTQQITNLIDNETLGVDNNGTVISLD